MKKKPKTNYFIQNLILCDLTLPWVPEAENKDKILDRYKSARFSFVSLSVGVERMGREQTISYIKKVTEYIDSKTGFHMIYDADEINKAIDANSTGIGLHFQGSEMLDKDPSNIKVFYDLGIRHMLLAKDYRSRAADGCYELSNSGLSDLGRLYVREMNSVGMIIDLSHMGYSSSMEAAALSNKPVIFSHSNPHALKGMKRNIIDEQIIACANSGGVVGLTGFGHFLPKNDTSAKNFVKMIDYISNLVGAEHVALGLDYVYYQEQFLRQIKSGKFGLPSEYLNNKSGFNYIPPEQVPEIAEYMLSSGYDEDDIKGIMGQNFVRVALSNWKK